MLLGSGVREKRVYDDDGRLVFRNRVSDYFASLVSDSLSYDNADHLIRAREDGYHRAADRSLISYDGLGAVLARENANFTGGANVEEFRNDAFGNMTRKMSRSTAGLINTAPFTLGYDVTGALRTWNTTLTNPTQSQYDRDDDLGQSFLNGQLIKQHQVIKDPDGLGISLTVGARHYYGADDKLMVVQRYSKRPLGVSDGTWEEYWYDALGRRVLTRVRRNGGSPYDATHDPLCHDASGGVTCRSFKERVWWDGDQALVEERAAEGTSDVSNNGTIMNIHALTLDEPLAVVSTNPSTQTRIINYNWRGQGMSSVFPNGAGADTATSTASGTAQINWPAIGQAQTYFTPNLDQAPDNNTPDKWMGTFVANGQGTTGMLYRRNRYFDANTGRFTQEDPIGIAGGVNVYGFASGDPINFNDPFGLFACTDREGNKRDCPEPPGGPPVKLPEGRNGKPNEWVPIPGSAGGTRGTKYKPRYSIPSAGGGQPGASWDPEGHWDVDDGMRGRRRYAPDGTEVGHDNNPVFPPPATPEQMRRAVGATAGLGLTYWIISELTRLFPPRNLIPIP